MFRERERELCVYILVDIPGLCVYVVGVIKELAARNSLSGALNNEECVCRPKSFRN